ncbi:MAG: hypothetical protein WCL42_10830 [Chlorobiaceae bacterium]
MKKLPVGILTFSKIVEFKVTDGDPLEQIRKMKYYQGKKRQQV